MVILKEGPAVPMGSLSARGCKLLDQKLQVLITCWLCKLDLFSRVQQLEAVKNGKKIIKVSKLVSWLTGTPAGKNLSKLRTGIMKQSRSSVANEIGSLRELTKAPVADPLF